MAETRTKIMATLVAVEAPAGRTDGTVPQVHATLDGERTLCGRRIGEFWNESAATWDTWGARKPRRRCRRCLTTTEGGA